MKPQIITIAAWVANALETVLSFIRTGRVARAPRLFRIITYRSLGSAASLAVRGRLVYQAMTTLRELRRGATPAHAHLLSIYRAFDVVDVQGETVRISLGETEVLTTTDAGGFFEVELPAPGNGWAAGWHQATVATETAGQATADVFVPEPQAPLLIVSDLDDTAMDTDTTNNWRMLRTVLFRSAHRRRPVPGVPELYQALHAGTGVTNPVCYISSGAWNLYDVVLEYLDTHGLPRGGVLLNDWGSRVRRFRTVLHEHKSTRVAHLVVRFPTLPLLLIGDDTQEDPELYAQAARAHPGRVAAIWIRTVRRDAGRHAEVEALQREIAAAGTEFVYTAETEMFAEHARRRGWIGTAG